MRDYRDIYGTERRELLEDLGEVRLIALEKYAKVRASNRDRQAWGRLIVQAVEASAKIMKDSEIDELSRQVAMLKVLLDGKN